MPTTLKIIVIVLMISIIGLIAYIIYLSNLEKGTKETIAEKTVKKAEKKEKPEKIQLNIKPERQIKPIKTKKITKPVVSAPAHAWEKELLLKITKERLMRIQASAQVKKLDADELEVLSKIIEKQREITDWTELLDITHNDKTYGILNIAILDHLYLIIAKKDREEEAIKTAYLLDLINDGITLNDEDIDYLPCNLDTNATLIKILNNDLEIEDRTHKLTVQTVRRACLELVSNGGYKDLNWPAKQVICRIILDNLGSVVYNYENISKILSDENKIYLRLLNITLANSTYTEIVEKFSQL